MEQKFCMAVTKGFARGQLFMATQGCISFTPDIQKRTSMDIRMLKSVKSMIKDPEAMGLRIVPDNPILPFFLAALKLPDIRHRKVARQ